MQTGANAQIATGTTADVISASDPSQRYAIFLPSDYDAESRWPLVLVMDPRGKALVPLERIAGAAEELGFIVLSSYNTASDSVAEPNERAIAAMIEDAQDLFSIDTRRLYFAGHSGTARHAWVLAEQFAANAAGVIGFGAGLPNPAQVVTMTSGGAAAFAFFGGAGDTDYNYEEVRLLDWTLDIYRFPHVVEFYPGPHAWPDAAVFAHALEWMEIQAVRRGFATRTTEEVEDLYTRSLRRAREREAAGDVDAAWRLSAQSVADFRDLVSTAEAQDRLSRLDRPRARETKRLQAQFEDRRAFDAKVASIVERVRTTGRPLDVPSVVRELRLEDLRRRSERLDRPHEALAAQRKLESLFVRASFYRPRESIARGEWAIANAYLRLAEVIRPRDAQVCLDLGRTFAQLGDRPRALDALERAVALGVPNDSSLLVDPMLAPLRGESRFDALRGRY